MAGHSKTASLNYGDGGTTIHDGTQLLDTEFDLVYAILNRVKKADYGTTQPAAGTRETGDLWMDSSGTTPTLKYYDGGSWTEVWSSAASYTAGITMEDAMDDYTRNALIVENVDGDNLDLVATSAVPVTISIAGEVRQITSTIQKDISAVTVGEYDVFVKQDGSSGFTLDVGAAPYSVNADERIIGSVYLSDTGAVEWVQSDEHVGAMHPANLNGKLGAFEAYITNGSANQDTWSDWTTVIFDTEVFDNDGWFDNTTYQFTPQQEGYYFIYAHVTVIPTSDNGTRTISIFKNGTELKRNQQRNDAWTSNNRVAYNLLALVYLNGSTDYVEIQANGQHDNEEIVYGDLQSRFGAFLVGTGS
jgi:hypothetical protein